MPKYQFEVPDKLSEDWIDAIELRILMELGVPVTIKEYNWREGLEEYAQEVYKSGAECTYQAMGINYKALGVRCVKP